MASGRAPALREPKSISLCLVHQPQTWGAPGSVPARLSPITRNHERSGDGWTLVRGQGQTLRGLSGPRPPALLSLQGEDASTTQRLGTTGTSRQFFSSPDLPQGSSWLYKEL